MRGITSLAGGKPSRKKLRPWEVWAARILDTVAALKAEDLFGHLDNINTGDGTNARSRAAKCAVEVYRLAIDERSRTSLEVNCRRDARPESDFQVSNFSRVFRGDAALPNRDGGLCW